MKTRTIFASILVLLLATLSINSYAAVKQDRNLASFSKISVGSAFNVYLTQGSAQSVSVEIDEEYINDVVTTVANNKLTIKLKDGIGGNRNINTMNVYITIPTIAEIEASGAAKIQIKTPITSTGTIEFDLSGASKVNDATITCKKLDIEQSGASKCTLNVKADDINVDISGAANLTLSGNTKAIKVDASGASKADVKKLAYEQSDFDVSTAAKVLK